MTINKNKYSRRNIVKATFASPVVWSTPLITMTALPIHAQASAISTTTITPESSTPGTTTPGTTTPETTTPETTTPETTTPEMLPGEPDYTPNFTFGSTVFEVNEELNFIVNINALNAEATIGTLSVFIPNMSGFTITFDSSLTSVVIFGSENIDNPVWVQDTSVTSGLLLQNISAGVPPNGRSRIGVSVTSNAIGATGNFTANIQANSGGDTNAGNNSGTLRFSTQS